MPIFFPSEKMGCVIKAESHRVEYARLLKNEHDDDVLEYYDQPPAIPLDYLYARGHRQQPQHVADFFVLRTHAAGWEECKPTDELMRLGKRQPQRYVCDAEGVWHCPPGEAYAATLGLTYHVFPSDHINWVAQSNWQYLDAYYRNAEQLSVAEDVLARFDVLIEETPSINWVDLRQCLPDLDADVFHTALIHHRIYVDLTRYRLEDQARTMIPVYRDRAAELASLRCGHLHLTTRVLTIHWPHLKGGKTLDDAFPLSGVPGKALRHWLQTCYGPGPYLPEAPVWPSLSRNGSRSQAISARSISNLCLKWLGMSQVHALRHTFAKTMEEAGPRSATSNPGSATHRSPSPDAISPACITARIATWEILAVCMD